LGVCYMQSGDLKKSLSIFSGVLDLDATNERALECINMLKKLKTYK